MILEKANAAVLFVLQASIFIKALKYRRFGNDIVQSVSVIIFHGALRWLFFTIKNHLHADDYAATACAI